MKRFSIASLVLISCVAPAVANLGDPLTNGDFTQPLSVGWTAVQDVTILAGEAVFTEAPNQQSHMEQLFTLPAQAGWITFDYKAEFEHAEDTSDSFAASLLDPANPFNPLVPTHSDPTDPGALYYFLVDSSGVVLADPQYVVVTGLAQGWWRVGLNLSSLGGLATDALLTFDFLNQDTSYDSRVRLDNVAAVPTPSAVAVGLIGLLLVGLRRRQLG